jgi:hypothetical protein
MFIEYGTDVAWADGLVTGSDLQLMRILNLEYGINLVDGDGVAVLNYQMPKK